VAKESKRQKQVAELVKRNMGIVMMHEGPYLYGHEVLVTVTNVVMSPDMGIAKVYLSVFNTENKQAVILQVQAEKQKMRQSLANRIKRHIRRIPEVDFYIDETLDEMYKLNVLFDKLENENQLG